MNDALKSTTDSLPAAETDDRSPDHVFARLVLEAESRAIGVAIRELGPGFDAVVERLVALKGAVIVSGSGKSGLVGRKISATLASTGTPSHFLHPSDAMHGDLGRIQPTDALLLLSFGGETEDTLALAALVRQDGLPVISMTGKPESHLARISDFHLCIGRVTEVDTHTLAPTASTTVMMAMGDALALALARRRSFTPADFHKRHPGGQLGRMMMPVSNVLRFKVGQNLPLVADELSVGQVLKRAAEQGGIGEGSARPRPVGAVLLIDTDGRLSGIFTDADLRRRLVELGPAVLDQPIAQVMTRQPRTLSNDATVRDAVQLVRETRLDELPVVDAQGKPVGLIDVQDLVALKVIEATSK